MEFKIPIRNNKKLKEQLERYISQVDADYSDIRYEKMLTTSLTYNGKELSAVESNAADGYVIRVLKKGGFASISVTRPEDIKKAIGEAIENAKILARESENKIRLTFPHVVEDEVSLALDEDPREISLDEKLAVVTHYNDLVLKSKDVQTTLMNYKEVYRDKYFVSSQGSYIHEPLITTGINSRIIAKRAALVQTGRVSIGSSDGFFKLRNRDERFLKKAQIVSRLLDAEPVKGGTYNVVLDPDMAGVFVHEAFGHFNEADLIEHNPSLLDKMKIGSKLGPDMLDIVDDPTLKGQIGHYIYDDEGVAAKPTTLMEKGVLKGHLHSMKTAASFKEELTGHTVAEDYRYAPLVRMGCIYIKPKDKTFNELLQLAGNGLYICECKGGQTSGENFTFGAQYAYLIQEGVLGPMVRDINLMGNLFTSIKSIIGISNNLELSEAGGCGKGQINIKSCFGGPHILIKDALIGGV